MRARPSMFVGAAVLTLLVAVGVAQVPGAPAHRAAITPLAGVDAPPAPQVAVDTDGLRSRVQQATAEAAAQGATVSVAVLDRATGALVSNGSTQSIATASVAKLFIADDRLLRAVDGAGGLSPDERAALDLMLRSSDDDAAELFWYRGGGDAIVTRVAERYGLTSTAPGSDGAWWNTVSTASDLARYYDMLLDGSGGLPPRAAGIILADLAESTAVGVDGYPQRFGIPEGLYAEPVAVKQGWMCCIGADWMHLSSGVVGADRRHVVVIASLQPGDDAAARATITRAVRTMFPGGRI